jgi:CheY-like chemotaxis protein
VDDDSYFLAWLSTYLEGEGFLVLRAQSAQEALSHCRQSSPIDLLLTDLLLPPSTLQVQTGKPAWQRMHGLGLAKEVEGLRPGIKVILMTGHSEQELSALKIARDGRPLLRKPFRHDTLLWTVNAVLEGRPPD